MARTLVLVHTLAPLVPAFTAWSRDLLPGVDLFHILDEPLLERIRRRGSRAAEDDERLAGHLGLAQDMGADAVLVTCSTISEAVGAVRSRVTTPVVAIDDALSREAVLTGSRIGLVATNPTTLGPSTRLLLEAASAVGRVVEVRPRLVDGALAAVLAGDTATHDTLVLAAVREVAIDVDVVVLAQATMARVLPAANAQTGAVPVLASPMLALLEVRRIIEGADAGRIPANGQEMTS